MRAAGGENPQAGRSDRHSEVHRLVSRHPLAAWPYPAVCAALGAALGWVPRFLHGPIPQKFDVLFIDGRTAIWAWFLARSAIGFWIGIARWPGAWWLRGPLIGFLVLLPLTLVSLAMPGCGAPCMRANLGTATVLGFLEAGLAFLLTGRSHLDARGRTP